MNTVMAFKGEESQIGAGTRGRMNLHENPSLNLLPRVYYDIQGTDKNIVQI